MPRIISAPNTTLRPFVPLCLILLSVLMLAGCSAPAREGFVTVDPSPYRGPSDAELAEKVEKNIRSKYKESVRDLAISASNGILTMAATVDSTDRVREIVQTVGFIDHVRDFRYKGVGIDAGDYSDLEVERLVWERINASPGKAVVRHVAVEVLDQFVRVGGTIDSLDHRNQMERSIRLTPGTEGYFITTQVIPPIPISDEMVTLNVLSELERFSGKSTFMVNIKWRLLNVPIDNVHVRTIDGVVTLSGALPKLIHKLAVEEVAKTAQGARDIHNQIVIQP